MLKLSNKQEIGAQLDLRPINPLASEFKIPEPINAGDKMAPPK